jgi:hypothetical protein
MKNRQPSLMVHTNPEFENFEFDQHLGSHNLVINIIMWFRDMGCYKYVVVAVVKGVPDPVTVKEMIEEHLLEVTIKAVEAVGKVD